MKIKNLLCAAAAVSAFVLPSIANAEEVEKAYTLTPVSEKTDTSITLFEYDKDTQTIKETHNELSLNKTNYGSGDTSISIDVSIPNNKTQTITVNYDSTNTSDKIVTTEGQNVNADFVNNNVVSDSSQVQGGAIYNYYSSLEQIKGQFINNSVISSSINSYMHSAGGAIYNYGGSIETIIGDFFNNSVSTIKEACGGAIYDVYGSIKNISGTFVNNFVSSETSIAYGGAIYVFGDSDAIIGNFIGNSASSFNNSAAGGAIFNYKNIEKINGDFINNTVVSSDSANGGAIYSHKNDSFPSTFIGDIVGDFIGNSAIVNSNSENSDVIAAGGAINNEITVNYINSNFIENSVISSGTAIGGAISNNGLIKKTKGDFIQNVANAVNGNAYGGAIGNNSSIFLTEMVLKIDDTDMGSYYILEDIPFIFETELEKINAIKNNANSHNGIADGGFLSLSNCKFAVVMEQHETTKSEDEHELMVQEFQQMIDEMLMEGYLVNSNKGDSDKVIKLKDSTFYNNIANGKIGANGGAISIGSISPVIEDDNESIDFYYGDEYLGRYYAEVLNGYRTENKIKIGVYNALEIKNSIFEQNIAKTVDGYARGGAIAIIDNVNIDNFLQTSVNTKEDLKNYYQNFANKEEALQYITDRGNWLTYEDAKEQYEVDNPISNVNIENTSFFNNTAISENGTALGGAIYSESDLTITADGKDVTFAGNKTISAGVEDDNAIYLDKNAVITFDIKNNAQVNMIDNINGTDGFGITITGDSTGTFNLLNTIGKANLSLGNANINMLNDKVNTYELNTLTAVGNSNLYVDVDLANKTMDRFTTTGTEVVHNGVINIAGMNLLSDAKTDLTTIEFADSTFKDNVTVGVDKVGKGVDNKFQTTAYSPIYAYDVTYDPSGTTGNFVFKGGPSSAGNNLSSYAPAVAAKPIAQSGAQSIQTDSYTESFRNMDMFMLLKENERLAYKYKNKYASTTGDLVYDPTMSTYDSNTAWFRPYTTFEDIPLKNGPKISNIKYGTYFGYDSALHELGKGWDGTYGIYAGYNGSHQTFQGNSIYQNGGTLGLIGVAYKGNFFTGLTANIGASAGSAQTLQGTDNFTSLMGGISSKTGYNFEFAEGKVILQPSMMVSYSLINTFDYTTSTGVRMKSDPLHTIQLEPSVKVIGNIGSWQPYANVAMVWNVLNDTKVTADEVALPEVSIKPYVKYGVGLQKKWADKFTAFGQCYVTNGGRNGVGLQAGLRIALGDETTKQKTSLLNPKKKDTKIAINGRIK